MLPINYDYYSQIIVNTPININIINYQISNEKYFVSIFKIDCNNQMISSQKKKKIK